MELISIELTRLVDDYFKCDNFDVKKLILSDIQLLTEALVISDEGEIPQKQY
ncbi:MAG: hypothetical protein R3250_07010 [Melioribacteraceae bacterium]|nr:hypothetical protein [Melioribacteraceae bacterium]